MELPVALLASKWSGQTTEQTFFFAGLQNNLLRCNEIIQTQKPSFTHKPVTRTWVYKDPNGTFVIVHFPNTWVHGDEM